MKSRAQTGFALERPPYPSDEEWCALLTQSGGRTVALAMVTERDEPLRGPLDEPVSLRHVEELRGELPVLDAQAKAPTADEAGALEAKAAGARAKTIRRDLAAAGVKP